MDRTLAPFRFEAEMFDTLLPLVAAVFDLSPGQKLRVLREAAVGSIIPDLMVAVWSGELPKYSKLNGISRHVLAWLSAEKKVWNEEKLRDVMFLSQKATASAVLALSRIGAIEKIDSGEIQLRSEFDVSHSVRLIAVEIKLKRWRQALEQAIEYRKFANEAYVVMDGAQLVMSDKVTDAFALSGVGLLLQHGKDLCKAVPARSTTPAPSDGRLLAVSKLVESGPYCFA